MYEFIRIIGQGLILIILIPLVVLWGIFLILVFITLWVLGKPLNIYNHGATIGILRWFTFTKKD